MQLVLTYFTEPIKNIFILPQKPNKIIRDSFTFFFFFFKQSHPTRQWNSKSWPITQRKICQHKQIQNHRNDSELTRTWSVMSMSKDLKDNPNIMWENGWCKKEQNSRDGKHHIFNENFTGWDWQQIQTRCKKRILNLKSGQHKLSEQRGGKKDFI